MNLDTELREAIDKNLPSLVGDQLKRRLEEADRTAQLFENQKKILADAHEKNKSLVAKIDADDKLIKELEAEIFNYRSREDAMKQSEQKVAEAKSNEAVATAVAHAFREAMGMVFGNNIIKRTVFESMSQRPNGGYAYDANTSKSIPTMTEIKNVTTEEPQQ